MSTRIQSLFLEFLQKYALVSEGERILLAVSGGIDSIVMCELFFQINQPFAHFNAIRYFNTIQIASIQKSTLY